MCSEFSRIARCSSSTVTTGEPTPMRPINIHCLNHQPWEQWFPLNRLYYILGQISKKKKILSAAFIGYICAKNLRLWNKCLKKDELKTWFFHLLLYITMRMAPPLSFHFFSWYPVTFNHNLKLSNLSVFLSISLSRIQAANRRIAPVSVSTGSLLPSTGLGPIIDMQKNTE